MKRALIGNGGHAREVMMQIGKKLPCFVDDAYLTDHTLPLSCFNPKEYEVMIAVGSSQIRFDFVNKLPESTNYFSYIHPTAIIVQDVEIGKGSFIGANTIITTNVKLGNHTILNRGNHIGHDTTVGSYLSMMPGAIISGNCNIGDCVYIGTNASIKEQTTIHSLVTIGMGATVVNDIVNTGIYVGVPARKQR
jgi:sugar O-acyltransferase (sialic acid O-acetyltransferase NeuD family)